MASKPQFKSTTLEGAFLEAAFLLQKAEIEWHLAGKDKSQNENNPGIDESLTLKYINITIDTDQQRAVVTATIPIGIDSNSFGGYLIAYQFVEDEYVNKTRNIVDDYYVKE